MCNPSRSPDLRILSRHTAFSGAFPMTDFHQRVEPPRLQWRYRSGFTPDFLFSAAPWSDTATLSCCFIVMPSIRPSGGFVNSHYNEVFLTAVKIRMPQPSLKNSNGSEKPLHCTAKPVLIGSFPPIFLFLPVRGHRISGRQKGAANAVPFLIFHFFSR